MVSASSHFPSPHLWFCCGTFCSISLLPHGLCLCPLSSCFDVFVWIGLFHHPLYACPHSHSPFVLFLSFLTFSLSSFPLIALPVPAVQLSCPFFAVLLLHANCPPSTHTSPFLWPLSYLSASITPSLLHHSSPPRPPSRDNYYNPCEDQLVFKQLNKQGPGLLTVTIQLQSSETDEWKIIVCVQRYRGHLKTLLME